MSILYFPLFSEDKDKTTTLNLFVKEIPLCEELVYQMGKKYLTTLFPKSNDSFLHVRSSKSLVTEWLICVIASVKWMFANMTVGYILRSPFLCAFTRLADKMDMKNKHFSLSPNAVRRYIAH